MPSHLSPAHAERRRSRLLVWAGAALAVAGLSLGLTASGAAAVVRADAGQITFVLAKGQGGSASGTIDSRALLPGAPSHGEALLVRNSSGEAVATRLWVSDVLQTKGPCTHAKRLVEPGCDDEGPGELGDQLRFAVVSGQAADGACRIPVDAQPLSPALADVDLIGLGNQERPIALADLAENGSSCLGLRWWLPDRPDNNRVMGDSITFSLNVDATGADVEGVKVGPGHGGSPGSQPGAGMPPGQGSGGTAVEGVKLAHTGATVAYPAMMLGAGLLGAGFLLILLGRRTRKDA